MVKNWPLAIILIRFRCRIWRWTQTLWKCSTSPLMMQGKDNGLSRVVMFVARMLHKRCRIRSRTPPMLAMEEYRLPWAWSMIYYLTITTIKRIPFSPHLKLPKAVNNLRKEKERDRGHLSQGKRAHRDPSQTGEAQAKKTSTSRKTPTRHSLACRRDTWNAKGPHR